MLEAIKYEYALVTTRSFTLKVTDPITKAEVSFLGAQAFSIILAKQQPKYNLTVLRLKLKLGSPHLKKISLMWSNILFEVVHNHPVVLVGEQIKIYEGE